MDQETREYFSTESLARHIEVSKKSIEKWRDERRIPGAVRVGRVWRFRRVDVERQLLTGQFPMPKRKVA